MYVDLEELAEDLEQEMKLAEREGVKAIEEGFEYIGSLIGRDQIEALIKAALGDRYDVRYEEVPVDQWKKDSAVRIYDKGGTIDITL